MNIHEFQAKEIFRKAGIPVPPGEVAETPEAAEEIARRLGGRVVVKAQVHSGGRGKAGGVKLASNPEEARAHAQAILGMDIKGLTVEKVLVTPAEEIATEAYVGMPGGPGSPVHHLHGLLRGWGGHRGGGRTPIPTPSRSSPSIPATGFFLTRPTGLPRPSTMIRPSSSRPRRSSASSIRPSRRPAPPWRRSIRSSPRPAGEVKAIDAKMSIDDNELFRKPDIAAYRDLSAEPESETKARNADLSYVKLDGNVGCCVNGAGLAMATMDLVKYYGGEPANFLDIGGSSNPDKVVAAFEIITSDPNVKVILFNIFGGITRCDDVANGIVEATKRIDIKVPLVIRLTGTNEEEGVANPGGSRHVCRDVHG